MSVAKKTIQSNSTFVKKAIFFKFVVKMTTLEWLRSFRLGGIALFDLITAFAGMIFLAYIIHKVWFPKSDLKMFIFVAVLLTIPVGMVFHWLFGVKTKISFNCL
jgi:hypothetical protein